MTNRFKNTFFLLLTCSCSFVKAGVGQLSDSTSSANENAPKEFVFKPTIGLGTGMFSFYGDLYAKHFQSPSVSRIAYDLNVSQRFTDYLQLNFYVLFGKLGANERYTNSNRNLNFESEIRVGGLNFMYNFGHFLPKDRSASPFITLGIESFEFLSKTDIYDKSGNRYYYWSDGSIKNINEQDPNAAGAITLYRDYTYESDIREMNLDGFGKYSERSWAIPVGIGAIFKINDFWDFKLGTTMHFSFTDYIDGVTKNSTGDRIGTSKNDNFMMTSFSIHYNLGLKNNEARVEEDNYDDIDFLALDMNDQDKDGVVDTKDSCQGTPEGVPVDAKGCPFDDDDDGVPNYKDDEINSPAGAFVDGKGVQMSDSLIAYQYDFYMDSIGAFATVEYHDHTGKSSLYDKLKKEYSVELGRFKKGLSPELMTKFLSINDISTGNIDDSTTVYSAGSFNNLLAAEKRRQELVSEGLTGLKVIYKQNGKYFDAPAYVSNSSDFKEILPPDNIHGTGTETNKISNDHKQTDAVAEGTANVSGAKGVVFRVQLGAYHRHLSKNVFKNVSNLIEVKTKDSLYKYMSGSFTSIDDAAKHKVELLLKGYQGAFITAYKDGKRVTLREAGATLQKPGDYKEEESDTLAVNSVDKKLITFKIQIGVFKNEPPADKQAKFDKIKGFTKEVTPTGLNRYIVGPYNNYNAALAAKDDFIKNYAIEDAFIIAFFNGEYISIQEALELLK